MKQIILAAVFVGSMLAGSCDRINNDHSKNMMTAMEITPAQIPEQDIDSSGTDDHVFLKNLQGRYPKEVKLFDNPIFGRRLKTLLGHRYYFLVEAWNVETPIEYNNNEFIASACQVNNCDKTGFIIVFNFSEDVMYVGIREGDMIKTYSENGRHNIQVEEWVELH